ncbi:type II toxin-antitoxin system VapC family toxin [Terriglobus saanensis]|uniref:type II toxin-antitoxin system VapC family toxin n=1 Tax=Terriglobus saanensis TaxID=870903 RepID=UPI002478CD66|nr:type II toxin-antitoxin system VapC family toxin [Terriglobus saanensis]
MDTSALVKLFIAEQGTNEMLRFANAEDDRNKVISALAQIEARSAICRLRQGNFIDPAETALALNSLADEIRRVIEQPLNPPVIEAASTVIDRYYLRALDAAQLGSAIVARDLLGASDMRFIASDKALLEAAHEEGFDVWDPVNP